MNTLMSSGTGLSVFACSAEECLSWIIILLNILTVFYLVFCAWYRVTKAVKVIGYVWASALTVGTVAVVAIHTCIFTILSAVFTALIIMAVLSVVLNKGVFANTVDIEDNKKPTGCYVIHKTDKNNLCFVLYDNKKNPIAKSWFKYTTIEQAKGAIEVCRNNGRIAAVEDKTKNWIEFVNHPKFQLDQLNGKFNFVMALSKNNTIIQSDIFTDYDQCKKVMNIALSAVLSDKLFYAEREILSDTQFHDAHSDDLLAETVATTVETVNSSVTSDDENSNASENVAVSLSESLKLAQSSTKNEIINKKYIADYLENKYGDGVIVNRRANAIRSGRLPLADTHYVLNGKNKVCFAFVYETEGNVLLLLNLSEKLGKKFAETYSTVNKSLFPKSKDSWYSVIVDGSFKCEDIDNMLDESYLKVSNDLSKKR